MAASAPASTPWPPAVKLDDFAGQLLVLCSYPEAETPGTDAVTGGVLCAPADRDQILMFVFRRQGAVALAALACALLTGLAARHENQPVAAAATAGLPRLSHQQIQAARRVLRSDTRLTHLFQGTPYRVAHLGPWSTAGARDRLIGVVFFVDLERPVNAAGLWPETVYEPHKPFPSYSQHYEYFKVVSLRSAMISVDLQRQKVADVRPGGHG
jgi:hypothetical protein